MSLIFETAEPVSHVLLFDDGTPQQVRALSRNTRVVSDCYRKLLSEQSNRLMEYKYKVIFAVPNASSLAGCCEEESAELKAVCIHCLVARIKAEDMSLSKGKARLLSCVLWCIAGAVLLNEDAITFAQAETLLLQANRLCRTTHHLVLLKQGWLQLNYGVGLVRSCSSIGHLLRGVISSSHEHHSVSDLLRAMKASCSREDLYVAR